jgi:ribonucleoside-triphosphate reductase
VSTTVTVKPHEWNEVGDWMWQHQKEFTALSVLPHSDHSYKQAPFSDITKEKYEELVKSLHSIDLTQVVELDDNTELADNLACAAGGCVI